MRPCGVPLDCKTTTTTKTGRQHDALPRLSTSKQGSRGVREATRSMSKCPSAASNGQVGSSGGLCLGLNYQTGRGRVLRRQHA